MGVMLALLAGILMPLTNLTVRKSVDVGGTTKGYFVFQMLSSFLFALLIGPCRSGNFSISLPAALLGSLTGVILSLMLFSLGKAIEKGPPGFTFAILNSATVMPGLLMALIFGAVLGFDYNLWHALGSVFVLVGIFWAAKDLHGMKEINKWIFFSAAMFIFHILLLCIYQFRALLLNSVRPDELFSFFSKSSLQNECFTPFMFLASLLVQLFIFYQSENRKFKRGEILYGFAGGFFNLLVTTFLIAAAVNALPWENAIIFPIFSVVGIILTNAWGQRLYQEQVNWRACQVCLFGLVIGTVDWKTVAAAIGF